MTISFSGLASGLDTSSWVESLVALKQAKVETLEEEKETVLLSQETLNNIKSFFSSFRSLIEKVTDAKFGVASMDLFTQNLATSSNLDVLTASATTEAEEATYNVLVDNLATETQAVSNYSYLTTIIQTTTATNDSKLSSLGVKAGNIGVTVNGVERGVVIGENDTIADLIEKLQNIGVEASYNEQTGVFSMNVDAGAINDIDGTGIVDALHLEGVNEGYTSDHLQTSQTDTVYSAATEATLLSELGVSAGVITIHANDRDYNITITNSSTLGSFISDLENNDIEAELDATGVFTISDAEITNEGTTDILDALGLAVDIYGKSQTTGDLTHETIITQMTTATSSTLLRDLGDGTAISNGQTVIVRDSNNEYTTITVGTTTTLGNLLEEMSNAGLYAALNSDGTVEIAGGTITGGTFDAVEALGLEREPYTAMVTGDPLTETVEVHKIVDLHTRLVDDLKVTEGYLEVTDADGNKFYEKIYSGQTIGDFMTDMGNLGIATSLDEDTGILTITGGAFKTLTDADVQALVNDGTIREPDSRYIHGTNLLECLYGSGTISTDHITVASTYSKTMALSHQITNTINASLTTSLGNLGLTNGTAVFDVRGEQRTINVNQTMTIEGLMQALENVGISSSWDTEHSKLMIENSTLTGGTSNLSYVLNLTTEVSGKYVTSNELYSRETITIDATRDTVLADYGISNSMSTADRTVNLYNSDGSLAASMVVNENTTIGNLLDWINSQADISATLEDGYLTIDNGYIENATLEASMSLDTSNKSSYVLGSIMTVTTTAAATGETTLGEIITTLGSTSAVSGGYSLNFNGTDIAVSSGTTVNELIELIESQGGTASLDSTGRLIIEGGTISGTVATALGIVSTTHTSSVSSTGETLYTTREEYADLNTTFADLGINSSSYIIHNNLGDAIRTVNVAGTDTIGSFFETLSANGIDATISNGVISMESSQNRYITGALANALGLTTQTVTEVVNTTQSSTLSVTHTGTVTADVTSTLGEIGAVTGSGQNILIYDENQTCIGTISTLTTSSTIGDMFDALKEWGINATITNGVISFYSESGRYAAGTIMNNLGVTVENGLNKTFTVAETTTSTGLISYTELVKATEDDIISEFITLPSNRNVVVHSEDGTALGTVTVTSTMTFGEFLGGLSQYGLEGSMLDGVIRLTGTAGEYATGDILNSLGIGTTTIVTTSTVGMTSSSSSALSYTDTIQATEDSLIADYITLPSNRNVVIYNSSNNAVGTVSVTNTMTFGQLFSALSEYGIDGDIHDGVIKFTSDNGEYATGAVLNSLGITTEAVVTTLTVGMSATSDRVMSYTENVLATGDSVIGDFISLPYDRTILVNNSDRTPIGTVLVSDTMTFDELLNALAQYGVTGTITDGVIKLSANEGQYATGEILDMLGISTTEVTTITTVGTTITSGTVIYQTAWVDATENSYITDYVALPTNRTITVMNSNGTTAGTFTVGSDMTFGDLFDRLEDYGITGTITNGVISLDSDNGRYATGALMTSLGIGNYTVITTTTTGMTATSNDVIYHTGAVIATESGVISDFITMPTNRTITVRNSDGGTVGSFTVSNSMTFGEMFNQLSALGITATINNGTISFSSSSGRYATGDVLTAMGVSTYSITVTKTVGINETSDSVIYHTYTVNATQYSTISDFISLPTNRTITVNRSNGGGVVGTFTISDSTTFEEMFDKLADLGITASISNGYITMTSSSDYYATGPIIDAMGVETSTVFVTTTHGIAQSSDSIIYHTAQQVATSSSLVSDFVTAANNYVTIRSSEGTAVGTVTVGASDTFLDFFNRLDSYGITGSIDSSGVITLTPYTDIYVTGALIDALGIETSTTTVTTTIGTRLASTAPVYYTTTETATGTSKISDIIDNFSSLSTSERKITVFDTYGNVAGTITVTSTTTINDLVSSLRSYPGMDVSFSNGVISIAQRGGDYYYARGTIIDRLGMETSITGGLYTMTNGVTNTSTTPATYTAASVSTSTYVADILAYTQTGASPNPSGNYSLIAHASDGSAISTLVINTTSNSTYTLNSLMSWIRNNTGATVSLSSNQIVIGDSPTGRYVTGSLASALGISTNTTSDRVGVTITSTMDLTSGMTLQDITGITNSENFYINIDGTPTLINFVSTDTVADMMDKVDACGFSSSLVNGKWVITPTGSNYIQDISSVLRNKLGFPSYYTTKTENTNSSTLRAIVDVSGSTMISTYFGSSTNRVLQIRNNGSLVNVTFGASTTVNQIFNTLSNYGYTCSISNGVATLTPTEDGVYITTGTQNTWLKDFLKLSDFTTTTRQYYHYSNDVSDKLQVDVSNALWTDTQLGQIASGVGPFTISIRGTSANRDYVFRTTDTIQDVIDFLADYGITARIDDGGFEILATNSSEAYITDISTDLAAALKLSAAHAYTTTTTTIISNTTSDAQRRYITATADSTFGEIGLTANGTINVYYNGSNHTITVRTNSTIESVFNSLETFGISTSISGGRVTLTGGDNAYITGGTMKVMDVLRMTFGYLHTYETDTYTDISNTTSDNLNRYETATSSSTLSEIGMTSQGTVTIVRNGAAVTVTVQASNTIQDLFNRLSANSINAYISNGRVTLEGDENAYILSISSNLQNALNVQSGLNQTYSTEPETTWYNTDSSNLDRYEVATGTSTFGQIGLTSNGTINVTSNGVNYTITVRDTQTINDIFNRLESYGISTSISGGRVTLTGNDNAYITSMSSNVQDALNITAGNNYTYDTTAVTTYYNDDSDRQQRHETAIASNTFGEIGMTSDGTITVKHEGRTYTITVSSSQTIDNVLSTLQVYGISGYISNGRVTLTGNNDSYILSMSSNVQDALNLTAGAGHSYNTTSKDILLNTPSSTQERDQLTTAATDTTFGDLGMTADGTINVTYNGVDYTVTVTSDHTLDDILTTLAGYGVSGAVLDGRLTLTGTEDGYITSMSSNVQTALGITAGANRTYTTSVRTENKNSTSNQQNRQEVTTMHTGSTLAALGLSGNATINVTYNGTNYIVSITPDKTIDDVISTLAGFGVAGSVVNGRLTLTGTEDGYITSMSDNLEDVLRITAGANHTYTSSTDTLYKHTASNEQQHNTVRTMSTSTTLDEIGLSGNAYITVVSNGTQHVVTVTPEMTVDDVISTLAGYGISGNVIDGRISFTGGIDTYIRDMSQSLKDVLKLEVGNGNSWTTEVGQTWVNSDSDEQEVVKDDLLITGDTVLSSINGFNNGNGRLVVHQSNGQFTTITVDSSSTVDEFFDQIAAFGLVGTIGQDGKVTITGVGNVYLQATSGGSNILTALNLSNVVSNVQTITSNRTSDTLTHTVTVAASGSTTLENLGDIDGNSINFNASGNVSLVLETTSGAGNQRVTLNFSRTQSLYDVIDALAGYGIQASIDSNGRFSVTSSSLTDFDFSGELGDFLMGNYTKEYGKDSTYNVSTNLIQTTIMPMDDSTLLTTFGITGGDIRITQQGVDYTINIDLSHIQTIGDFRNLLAQYGFSSMINSEGRLSVSGIGESYLSSVSGGSNILDKLGLTDWTLGEITQNSGHLTDTEVVVNRISMSDKISELTDAAGNNLGITDGQIYVYQDGTRSTINIDTNDTLETLAAKLSQYGITVGISQEGRLYFDGNNDSYLTTNGLSSANASNILSRLNIEGNWSTRYDSTSQKLQYTEEVVDVVTRNTKLSDLKDSSGNDLNITEGTYYVYSNGVRNTETITADMTVNDLMATLAQYGLVADIAEDGSISVGAYNNTYLATSALAGQNSNIVSTLFAEWDFVNIYTSNGLDIPTDEIRAINRDTKLADINEGTYQEGYITVIKDGVQTNIELTADDTVGTLMDELALYGFESVINENGQLIIKNSGDSLLQNYTGSGQASNALTLLGIGVNDWINTNTYKSDTLNVIQTSTLDASASRDTLLSELGVSTGEYYIYNNGVRYTALISSDETLGSFMDTLKSFGLETSLVQGPDGAVLSVVGKGDSYVAKSTSTTNASNVVDVLFTNGIEETNEYSGLQQTSTLVTTFSDATLDTKLSYYDTPWGTGMLTAEGDLSVTVNGVDSVIKITADETFGSLIEKFNALGLEATLANGELMIQSGYDTFTINTAGTTSSILSTIGLTYHNDLGGYVASQDTVISTTTGIEERTLSVANYADMSTRLGTLNISDGSLTVYRNGERATVQIQANDTFSDLQARLSAAFSDLRLEFQDGYLTFYSADGNSVEVGATTDTSNFAAITGISNEGTGTVKSARELYKVNTDSVLTSTGLFRNGDITEGTFVVGNATFNITDTTTLANLISQINSSDEANATAYWDNIDGKLVIKSRTTGSAFVNIEAGTSNFTDIMGYTSSEWAADGSVNVTRMNIDTQEVGQNARVQINGTTYTSTSNTITSDVSRIKGLTINLKGLTEGTAVTLTVERDKETLANAISDIVDSYNELMSNVDEAIAIDGALHGETTLKLIRNQLRNLMTSSDAGTTIFRNLDSIGISVSDASGSNISTTNEAIINLTFDKDKFIDAFEADQDAVKELLIGGANNTGIFTKVETLLESSLQSVTGYFSSADDTYQREISRLNDKIDKANADVEKYRARLEAKFASMDMLIAQMQQQYSTFLTT